MVRKTATSDARVLVRGEYGTGKDLASCMLHELSLCREGPFATVHCAALPEMLLESEFFGHEQGALTGAHKRKLGHLELAEGGPFFLDKVGEIPLSVQAKLPRLFQERESQRVGDEQTLKVDVRVVRAT